MRRVVVIGTSGVGKTTLRERIEARDRWVADGNYHVVRDLLWPAADTAVWIDLSRWRTTARVATRSLRRVVTQQELWHGNRETLDRLLSWDPERSIVRWSWRTHPERREEFTIALADPRWQPLDVHRLRTPGQVETFVRALG